MEVLLRMDEKRTIFRMRSINDNTLKAFFNDEVYASSPLKFNDPYDDFSSVMTKTNYMNILI